MPEDGIELFFDTTNLRRSLQLLGGPGARRATQRAVRRAVKPLVPRIRSRTKGRLKPFAQAGSVRWYGDSMSASVRIGLLAKTAYTRTAVRGSRRGRQYGIVNPRGRTGFGIGVPYGAIIGSEYGNIRNRRPTRSIQSVARAAERSVPRLFEVHLRREIRKEAETLAAARHARAVGGFSLLRRVR